jgi:hypothetical protein
MNRLILFEDFDVPSYKGKMKTKSNVLKRETEDINDYPTPIWFIQKLKEILRPYIGWKDNQTVDLCCNKNNIKFPKGFTLKGSYGIIPPLRGDSLQQDWHKYGKFGWLASPYNKVQSQFIQKATEEAEKGMIIIALFQTNADAGWYKTYVSRNKNCEFIQTEGRLKYPQSKHQPSFGVTVAIFGIKRGTLPEEVIYDIETLPVHYNIEGKITKRGQFHKEESEPESKPESEPKSYSSGLSGRLHKFNDYQKKMMSFSES